MPSVREPLDVETGDGRAQLLNQVGASLPPEPQPSGPLKPVADTTISERAVAALAICAGIAALVAIIVDSGPIVIVAGILSILTGPYAYLQQTKLTDIKILKDTNRVVRNEVCRLEAENVRLEEGIRDLETTVDDLQDIEEALQVISSTQGQSVAALEQQVLNNKKILETMRKSTKGRVLQNLIAVVARGDKNMDDKIDDAEVDAVVKNLKQIHGVTVHEDRLRDCIVGKSIDSIIDAAQNLLSEETPEGGRIFEISE